MSKLRWDFLFKYDNKIVQPRLTFPDQVILDPINGLPHNLPRTKQNPRFPDIGQDKYRNDELIFAHLGLAYKEMLKSCLEGFYEYQLDSENLDKQLRGLSEDGYGGVNYFNYQFSDRYEDEDKCSDKPLNTTDMRYYAKLSISDALAKYFRIAEGWDECCTQMADFYQHNIHTYQGDAYGVNVGGTHSGRKEYECDLFPSGVRAVKDDCTSFCWACIQYYIDSCDPENEFYDEIMSSGPPRSLGWSDPEGKGQDLTKKAGFEVIPYDINELKPFDIVMGNQKYGCSHGHGEIYIGNFNGRRLKYGWGNIADVEHGGLPKGYGAYNYNWIFRLAGFETTEDDVRELVKQIIGKTI